MNTPFPTRAFSNFEYPSQAGRPRVETDFHVALVRGLHQSLESHFVDPLISVASNLLIFYVPGDRRRHVTTDLFVVRGVAKRERPNYLVWEEGKSPDFVLEVTTLATRAEDADEKFRLYRDVLLVPEYFLYDPQGDTLDPPLQGYRLHNAGYLKIDPLDGILFSNSLGLHLKPEGPLLRFFDPEAQRWLPTPDDLAAEAAARHDREIVERQWTRIAEQQLAVKRAIALAENEQSAAALAQAGATRLLTTATKSQDDVARLHAEAAQQLEQATARQQAALHAVEEAARQQAEYDRLREQIGRLAAEAEVERLRKELEFLRRHPPSGNGSP